MMTAFILSPYKKVLDMSDKDYVKLYEKGSKKLPGKDKYFRLFIKDVASCTTECKWDLSILIFKVNDEDLNLIKEYGRIPMSMVTLVHDTHNLTTPTTAPKARPFLSSSMIFRCPKNSLNNKCCHQLMPKLSDIKSDGPIMFKQITVDTFTTSQVQTFSMKMALYSLDLKAYKFNIPNFHQDIGNEFDTLNVIGKMPGDEGIIIWLFKAYNTTKSSLFKEHVCYLKSEYNKGRIARSKELMLKVKAKYD
jgi:hypothetical protein